MPVEPPAARGPGCDVTAPLWQLLDPSTSALPFFGRLAELDALQQWRQSPRLVSVRTVVGGAGRGKTRLAMEFTAQVTSREPNRWSAGFVNRVDWPPWLARAAAGGMFWQRPTLLVVDDAALEVERLRRFLRAVARRPAGFGPPLRMLLLARAGSARQGWLRYLQEEVASLFDPVEPVNLPALPGEALRHHIQPSVEHNLHHACAQFPPAPQVSDGLSWHRQVSGAPRCFDADQVVMASVLAGAAGLAWAGLLGASRTDLALALADLELHRLAQSAPPNEPEAGRWLVHLAACATALGGLSVDDLEDVAQEEALALGWIPSIRHPEWTAGLAREFPNAAAAGIRIRHRLVGGAFVLRAFGSRQLGPAGPQVIERLARRRPNAVARFLGQLAADFAGPRHPEALEWIEMILDRIDDPHIGWLLETVRTLPGSVPGIRGLTTRVFGRMVETLRPLVPVTESTAFAAEFGRLVGELSWRLADLGRFESALEAAQQAEELGRELARLRPTDHRGDWADALEVLAYRLSDLGLADAAVAEARHAEAICAADAAQTEHEAIVGRERQDHARARWASSLEAAASVLERAQRLGEAQAAAAQAVEIRRQLAIADGGRSLPRLAVAQSRLGILLGACGRTQEAMAMLREAEGACEALGPACPSRTVATWAAALGALSQQLARSGSREDSLACAEQAVRVWHQLGGGELNAFLPDLGRALRRLAQVLNQADRAGLALASLAEAERVYAHLSRVDPGTYFSELALVRLERASTLAGLSEWPAALRAIQEVLPMLQALAEAQPDRFPAFWARGLEIEGACYRALPPTAEVLDHYGRAVTACCARSHTRSTLAGLWSEAGA